MARRKGLSAGAGEARGRDAGGSASGGEPAGRTGRFSYEGLDRVLHERARLSILASLAAHADGLLFNDLKQLCALTDGNLSRHLAVLSEAEMVEVWKGGTSRRPQTLYRLTAGGRQRFMEYIAVLERVVADAAGKSAAIKSSAGGSPRAGGAGSGWATAG
jgi:DNA-binding transcriptional ArsR family regulator